MKKKKQQETDKGRQKNRVVYLVEGVRKETEEG